MANGNLSVETQCPNCSVVRLARGDVVRKAERLGKQLFCKPCRNQLRFKENPHPRSGTGVKNNEQLEYTRRSFYKAKRRCKLGTAHHPCYAAVEFRISSLQELVDAIGLRPNGSTLDRVDTLGHYEIGNVRWATVAEQAANRMPRGYWGDKK